MAKMSDVTQKARTWLIGAVLLVAGIVVGQAIPQSTATPKAESGAVSTVTAVATGTTFVFRPDTGAPQHLVLLNNTFWQIKPGDWHTGGLPSCMSLKPHQSQHLMLGVVSVKGTGTLPDETMVVWVKCES
jgi:hypothetical protein